MWDGCSDAPPSPVVAGVVAGAPGADCSEAPFVAPYPKARHYAYGLKSDIMAPTRNTMR